MIIKAIPSRWLIEEEHRLDCGPFVKGGVEARKAIEGLRCRKDHLVELTQGGLIGIYHVGQDKIVWTEDNIHGMPFLRSADILKADLSYQPFISRKQVAGNHLFQCPTGTTLITRSGSIGRMAYMREDMEDTAISQDVLKVLPDSEKVKPGYLFAFLSSKYGIPIVTGGTFGSIIVHIEAENIAQLPVPRLSDVEDQAHELVQKAANNRVSATNLINEAIAETYLKLGMPALSRVKVNSPSLTVQSSRMILKRMDSFYYSNANIKAREAFDNAARLNGEAKLGDTADVWIPNIFKRMYVDDPDFGYPYFTGKEIYELTPSTDLYLKKDVAGGNRLILSRGMILVQDSGQLSGIIGRPVQVGKNLSGAACTNNMVRIQATDDYDNGYLFALLSTHYGINLLKREASGSSIPLLDEGRIKDLCIPWPNQDIRSLIGNKVLEALDLRDESVDLENDARVLVEHAIEEGAR
ncbi:MAG: restriction endonuclease subunit S [Pseudomonadota bacterium]